MDRDRSLRAQLAKILDWEDAHVSFDAAIDGIPAELRGVVPAGLPYSSWKLLDHLRITQRDILDFCRNPGYVEPPFEDYWPKSVAPPTGKVWDASVADFKRDREELKKLAADTSIDLFDRIPHGSGQTCLRELLLVADHNAYHIAQLVAVRRLLGVWES